MPSERVHRPIDRFLDEAEQAAAGDNWALVRNRSQAVLSLDPSNADAQTCLAAAGQRLADGEWGGAKLGAFGLAVALDRSRLARAEALRHLDLAIAEFHEMKMQPALERALRHSEVLKA